MKRPKTKRNNPKMTQKAKSKLPAPDVLHNVVKTGSTSTESTSTEICICLERAEGLPQADFLGTADPYVEVLVMTCDPLKMDLKKSEIKNLSGPLLEKTLFKATSRIIRGSLTPQWQESFYFSIPNGCEEATLYFRVLDYDLVISDDFLGHCSISLLKLGGRTFHPESKSFYPTAWLSSLQSEMGDLELLKNYIFILPDCV